MDAIILGINYWIGYLGRCLPRAPSVPGAMADPGRVLLVVSASVPGGFAQAKHRHTDHRVAMTCLAVARVVQEQGAAKKGEGPASAGGWVSRGPRDAWPVGGSRHRAPRTGLWMAERGQGRSGRSVSAASAGRDLEPLLRRSLSENADFLRITQGSWRPPCVSRFVMPSCCRPHRGSKFEGGDFLSCSLIYPQRLRQSLTHSRCLGLQPRQ